MALKLRRRLEVFTNGILQHRMFRRDPEPLGTGADSFKRVLGSVLIEDTAYEDSEMSRASSQ
jgi:hypothetical protein